MNKEILEVLSDLTTIDKQALESLFKKSESDEEMTDAEKAAVVRKVLADRFQSVATEKEKATKRIVMESFEREAKAKHGYEGKEQGLALIEKLISLNAAPPTNVDFSTWKEEDWEKQSAFKSAVANTASKATSTIEQQIAALTLEKTKLAETLEKTKNEIQAEKERDKKRNILQSRFLALNPNGLTLAEDKKTAKINRFIANFDLDTLKLSENNELQPIDKDGNPKQHGSDRAFASVTVDDLLKSEWWDGFHVTQPTSNSPEPPNGRQDANGLTSEQKKKLKDLKDASGDHVSFIYSLPISLRNTALKFYESIK